MSPYVEVSDEELILLDGRCTPKTQLEVDAAKRRLASHARFPDLPPRLAEFVVTAEHRAQVEKGLSFARETLSRCPTCDRRQAYQKYTRTTRHHRAGENNRDRPLPIGGIELVRSFIHFSGLVTLGCCDDCWKIVQPTLAQVLETVEAEIPKVITGHDPVWRRFRNQKCTKCEWTGHEGEMKKLPAMMGGHYAGGCPKCGAENLPFGRTVIESIAGYTVVPAEPAK